MDYLRKLKSSVDNGIPNQNIIHHIESVMDRADKIKNVIPSLDDMNGFDLSHGDMDRIRSTSSSDEQIGFGKQSLKNYGKETCIVCEQYYDAANRDFDERTNYLNEITDYLGDEAKGVIINNESTTIIIGPPTW